MTDRADLVALLREAAREAMPSTEAHRFGRFVGQLSRGRQRDLVPGTPWLPPITINQPSRRGRKARIRNRLVPDPAQPRLL